MDLVILSGSVGKGAAWTRGCIKSLLPLPAAGSTLIESLVRELDSKTAGKCIICSDGHKDQFICRLSDIKLAHLKIDFFEDSVPLGTAGCLKACEKLTDSDTILLIGGSVWLDDDPQWMLEQHRKSGNALTVFCTRDPGWAGLGSQRHLRPAGVYCCDRSVFDHIRPTGFQDLKEQLVPALKRAGLRVGAVALPHETCEVSDPATYLEIITRILARGRFLKDRFARIAPDIWCGRDVHIAAHARIVGPALLGHGCRIEDGAVIVGPTMLGDGSHIGRHARLTRIVAPRRLRVRPGLYLTDRVIAAPSTSSSRPSLRKPLQLVRELQSASLWQRATQWPRKLVTPVAAVGTVLFAAFIWAFWSSISNLWTYLGSNADSSAGQLVPVAAIYMAAAHKEVQSPTYRFWWPGLAVFVLGFLANVVGYSFGYSSIENFGLMTAALGVIASVIGRYVCSPIFLDGSARAPRSRRTDAPAAELGGRLRCESAGGVRCNLTGGDAGVPGVIY